MLIQSHQGYIELLPCITVDWHKGAYFGLRARGGFEVSVSWDGGKPRNAKIISYVGNVAKIKAEGLYAVIDENGVKLSQTEGDYLEFETEIGKTYTLLFKNNYKVSTMITPSIDI